MNDSAFEFWAVFFAAVLALIIIDLGLFNRADRDVSMRESLWLSVLYVFIAISFGGAVSQVIGEQQGRDYFTAWLVEKSLSIDNIFVMSLVFSYFHIPRRYQHTILFWGVMGAIVMRGLMIGAGVGLIHWFHSILYLFGLFLVFTGAKMLFMAEEEERGLEDNALFNWLKRHIKVTSQLHGKKFFVRAPDAGLPEAGRGRRLVRVATPLFLVLIFIELADAVFALDSVPAVLAITADPFVVYTSNIFAILGLRSLYFALEAMLHRFAYLKYALALVLIFIGGKIFSGLFAVHISSADSLLVTVTLLLGGVLVSLWKTKNRE